MLAAGVASVIDTLSVDEKLVPLAGVMVGVAAAGVVELPPELPELQPSINASRTRHGSARATSPLWRYRREPISLLCEKIQGASSARPKASPWSYQHRRRGAPWDHFCYS